MLHKAFSGLFVHVLVHVRPPFPLALGLFAACVPSAQSGQYTARLDLETKACPHSAQRFTASLLENLRFQRRNRPTAPPSGTTCSRLNRRWFCGQTHGSPSSNNRPLPPSMLQQVFRIRALACLRCAGVMARQGAVRFFVQWWQRSVLDNLSSLLPVFSTGCEAKCYTK